MALNPKSYCGFLDNCIDKFEKVVPIFIESSRGFKNLSPYNIIYKIVSWSGIETVIVLKYDLIFYVSFARFK